MPNYNFVAEISPEKSTVPATELVMKELGARGYRPSFYMEPELGGKGPDSRPTGRGFLDIHVRTTVPLGEETLAAIRVAGLEVHESDFFTYALAFPLGMKPHECTTAEGHLMVELGRREYVAASLPTDSPFAGVLRTDRPLHQIVRAGLLQNVPGIVSIEDYKQG